jgi:AcrR family transcriptional regulator
VAARLLLESPELSLGELAARIGIGRTTLHRMFPTREALLVAVAHDAIDHLTVVYAEAGLDPDGAAGATRPTDPVASFRRMVEMLVPLGPQLMFLLRAHELRKDADLERRILVLDEPLLRAVDHAQRAGTLDPGLPSWWVVESLYALVYIAWEQVERGRLASRDAAPMVIHTWLRGTQGPAS